MLMLSSGAKSVMSSDALRFESLSMLWLFM